MKYFWVYICVCVLVILFCAHVASQNDDEEGFASYIQVPLKVHVIRDMNMVWNNEVSLDSWISPDETRAIIESANAKFFRKYGIEWILQETDVVEESLGSSIEIQTVLEELVSLKRVNPADFEDDENAYIQANKADTAKREAIYKQLIQNTNGDVADGVTNLYFMTFTGNTRQGKFVENGSTPYVVIGQWSNKVGGEDSAPIKRVLDAEPPVPSLTYTVAHELAHVLGLKHITIGETEANIMNMGADTEYQNAFVATLDQEITMQRMARKLAKKYNADDVPEYTNSDNTDYSGTQDDATKETSYDASKETSYHASEYTIRAEERDKMNVFYVRGEDGKPMGINMAPTQTFPTFYTPGSFTYSASNYVPSYEDAVKLSCVDIPRTYGYEYDIVKHNSGMYSFLREDREPDVIPHNYDANKL